MEDNKEIELTDDEVFILALIGLKLIKDIIKSMVKSLEEEQANTV